MNVGIVSSFNRDVCGIKIYAERLSEELKKLGVVVKKIPINERELFYGFKLRESVKKMDIVEIEHHFGLFKKLWAINGFGIIPYFLKRPPAKTVTTFHCLSSDIYFPIFEHNPFFFNRFKAYRMFKMLCRQKSLKIIFDHSDAIITQTKSAYELLIKMGYKDKTYYFPHPTPRVDPKNLHHVGNVEFDLISFGILFRTKRYDLVFNALKDLNINYLLHVSKSPDKTYLNRLMYISKNIKPKVTFKIGFLSDTELFSLISKSKAVLIPPCPHEADPSGVLHDAIAVNKPVIAPNVGEYHDFSKYILVYNSLEEMKRWVEKIVYCERFRKNWESRAKNLAVSTSYERIAEKRIRLYEKLLGF